MIVFLNGQFVPEAEAVVSVFDRSFLYGDGLFETARIHAGKPFLWDRHLARLRRGASLLRLTIPLSDAELTTAIRQLVERNQMPEALLRLNLSRGTGPRGYSTKGCGQPFVVISLHSAPAPGRPQPVRLITASQRLPADDLLTQIKTTNKLPHIVARAEAETREVDDALLLSTHGEVAEATASNLFWISGDTVFTPSTRSGALAGITRGFVIELSQRLGLATRETSLTPAQLRSAHGAFLTNSVQGLVEVSSLDGQPIPSSPLTARLRAAYDEAFRAGH